MIKHKLAFALAALTAVSITACDGPHFEDQPEPPVIEEPNEEVELLDISAEFSLETSADYVKAGETVNVNIVSASSKNITVEWISSDSNILTVENGTVTGISKGTATVSAKISAEGCKDFELSCEVEVKPEDYTLAKLSSFTLITDISASDPEQGETLVYLLGEGRKIIVNASKEDYNFKKRNSKHDEEPYEILVGETNREESFGAGKDLEADEYHIKAIKTEEGMKVLLNAADVSAMKFAVEVLVGNLVKTSDGVFVPSDLDIRGKNPINAEIYANIFESENNLVVRDPCVIYDGEKYYMYGTRLASGLGYGCVTSDDLKTWSEPFNVYTFPEEVGAKGDCWAPECHYYNGNYYLFATYRNSNDIRGCAIFKSETPAGPFEMITDGHITSSEWNAIDATLYVDENGDPWFVYVREWVTAPNGVGTFEAARLSADLTEIVSEPVELFKSTDPIWAAHTVTDGCWFHKMESTGSLIMLWSNFDSDGYCIGMARSESGNILGPWEQINTRLYSKTYSGTYDGGHASIFTDKDGQMMISFHGPNSATDTVREHAFFLPIEEDPVNDMLVPKK